MRYIILILVALAVANLAQAASSSLRQGVVRIEVDIDAFSLGLALTAELMSRQPLTPYEGELARRYRIGSTGTGFFVNANGDLITNAHVLLSGVRYRRLPFTRNQWDSMMRLLIATRDIWVTVGEGEQARIYLAAPVAIAENLDLALLKITRPPGDDTRFNHLPIGASDTLKAKQPITALGFPENEFQATAGEILSLIHGAQVHEEMRLVRRNAPIPGEPPIVVSGTSQGPVVRLQHSALSGHGSSGGPLVDARNRVIGVCYALLADRSVTQESSEQMNLNLAIASNVLRRFLKEHAVPFTEAD